MTETQTTKRKYNKDFWYHLLKVVGYAFCFVCGAGLLERLL